MQLQFQLELPPLDHTQPTPASLDLKQTVLKWIKVVGECKATFISKSQFHLTYLEPLGHKLLSNNVLHLNCDILLLPLEGLLNWKTSNLLVTC